jgi:hypothetical protein
VVSEDVRQGTICFWQRIKDRRASVAYSVMVWLVNPGVHPQQEEEEVRLADGAESVPGAASGENVGYPIPRMVYGVYETQDEAEQALGEISNTLQQNAPLRISSQASRIWLIPADRVHYVVCSEVERPMDRQ